MVEMTKDSKKTYDIFLWLRKSLPNADVCTLRHVSVYIARTNDEFDINKDLQLVISDGDMCQLFLSNGMVIRFANYDSGNHLNFIVEISDPDVYMTMVVSNHETYNLSTAFVYGTVCMGDFEYLIDSDETDCLSEDYFIKVYYKGKIQEEATSYFKVSTENDIGLDCIDGLGHLTSVMTRIHLLYNNLKKIKDKSLVRKR